MHSKSQVRWTGPLEPFAAGFDVELARLGYTPAGTRRKLEAVAHLSYWLAQPGMTAGDIGPETIGEFVTARRASRHGKPPPRAALALVLRFPPRARPRPPSRPPPA